MSSLPGGGRHKEAQALPLSGMAHSKAGDSRGLQKVGAKGENVEKKGSGKEETSRTLSVKADGIEVTLVYLSGNPRRAEAGVCKWRASKGMWPPTAVC